MYVRAVIKTPIWFVVRFRLFQVIYLPQIYHNETLYIFCLGLKIVKYPQKYNNYQIMRTKISVISITESSI